MAKKLAIDKVLFTVVVVLVVGGLVMVYSANPPAPDGGFKRQFVTQLAAAIVGLASMLVVMSIDYRRWARPSLVYLGLGVSLGLLGIVLTAPPINGSSRWLSLGPVTFQPSELAKVAIILFLAYQIHRCPEGVSQPRVLAPCVVGVGLVTLLVLQAPDFGSAALILGISAVMLFLAGLSRRWIVSGLLVFPALLGFFIWSEPYRVERVMGFLSPENDPSGSGFQVLQSKIAIGSGGMVGQGLGESAQKLYFLPLATSDFIFSIVSEELGLIGAAAVLAAFAVLAWRGYLAGHRAPDAFGRFLAWGLTSALLIQALVNISVTVGLVPVTGTPLPFLSHGGSSLVMTLVACGLLLSVSEHG